MPVKTGNDVNQYRSTQIKIIEANYTTPPMVFCTGVSLLNLLQHSAQIIYLATVII
jgi:hypothetical protein